MRVDKEVGRWVRIALDLGWRVEQTKQKHLKFMNPRGGIVTVGSYHGTRSSQMNARAQLRRGGLPIPGDVERRPANGQDRPAAEQLVGWDAVRVEEIDLPKEEPVANPQTDARTLLLTPSPPKSPERPPEEAVRPEPEKGVESADGEEDEKGSVGNARAVLHARMTKARRWAKVAVERAHGLYVQITDEEFAALEKLRGELGAAVEIADAQVREANALIEMANASYEERLVELRRLSGERVAAARKAAKSAPPVVPPERAPRAAARPQGALLKPQQVADLLGVSENTVLALAKDHGLPHVDLGTRGHAFRRFRREDVDAWVAARVGKT